MVAFGLGCCGVAYVCCDAVSSLVGFGVLDYVGLTLWMICLGLCVGGLGFGGDSVVCLLVDRVMLIVLF